MRLTQIALQKHRCIVVLQGMIHIAPPRLYRAMQDQIDAAERAGHVILYERLKRTPCIPASSDNEKRIRILLRRPMRYHQVFARQYGLVRQDDGIRYPPSAINADIEFAELAALLDRYGCSAGRIILSQQCTAAVVRIGKAVCNQWRTNTMDDATHAAFFKRLAQSRSLPLRVMHRAGWGASYRRAVLEYRNRYVVAEIEKWQHANGLLVHYGERHIAGISALLVAAGWRVLSESGLDALSYCDAKQ